MNKITKSATLLALALGLTQCAYSYRVKIISEEQRIQERTDDEQQGYYHVEQSRWGSYGAMIVDGALYGQTLDIKGRDETLRNEYSYLLNERLEADLAELGVKIIPESIGRICLHVPCTVKSTGKGMDLSKLDSVKDHFPNLKSFVFNGFVKSWD